MHLEKADLQQIPREHETQGVSADVLVLPKETAKQRMSEVLKVMKKKHAEQTERVKQDEG